MKNILPFTLFIAAALFSSCAFINGDSTPLFSCCEDVEYIISKSGTTKVSPAMFGGVAKSDGVRERIDSEEESTFKSFVLVSYCWNSGRGKIWNITDETLVYKVDYNLEDGNSYTEEIEVLPRTFSRIMPKGQLVSFKAYE